jgi:hypothetical protein
MHPRQINGLWWLHPAVPFAAAGIGISAAAHLIPESMFRTYWRTPKFFDGRALELTLLCVAVFVFGSLCGAAIIRRRPQAEEVVWGERVPWGLMSALFRLSFWLCLLGYGLWTVIAVQRGITWDIVTGVLSGEKGAIYDARYTYLPTVGGVTTLTQFGSAALVFGAILGSTQGWRSVRTRIGLLGLIAVVRALLNSERFALIELLVPFLLTCLGLRYFQVSSARQSSRLTRFAPVLGVAALFILFTGFEYFRSWTNYYAGRELGLWEFSAMRLLGYYVTSFNNGSYLLQRLEPLNAPYFTLHFLWNFPLVGSALRGILSNPLLDSGDKWFYFPFLEAGANLEFNNADGMLFPLMDFGVTGGLAYWLVLGAVCGTAYALFCRKELAGLLLYPILFLGLLEVPLALYWGEGRAFPSLCLLLASPILLSLRSRQARLRSEEGIPAPL